jgi:hypothetical protein
MLVAPGLLGGEVERKPIPEDHHNPCGYWHPVSAVAVELVSEADTWQRPP